MSADAYFEAEDALMRLLGGEPEVPAQRIIPQAAARQLLAKAKALLDAGDTPPNDIAAQRIQLDAAIAACETEEYPVYLGTVKGEAVWKKKRDEGPRLYDALNGLMNVIRGSARGLMDCSAWNVATRVIADCEKEAPK